MRNRVFIGTFASIFVLALMALVVPELMRRKMDLTSPLLNPKDLTSLEKIFILDSKGSISLAKNSEGDWVLPEDSNFPAYAERVGLLLQSLSTTVPQNSLEVDSRDLDAVGLQNPNSITLSSAKGRILTIDLGTNRKGGGQYVRVGNNIFLIDGLIRAGTAIADWQYSRVWENPVEKIQTITLTFPANPHRKPIVLTHSKAERPMQLADLKSGEAQNVSPTNQTVGTVRSLHFSTKHKLGSAETKLATAPRVEARIKLFDGAEMGLRIWADKDGKEPVALFVPFSTARDVASLHKEWDRWVFQTDGGLVTTLEQERKDYLVKKVK